MRRDIEESLWKSYHVVTIGEDGSPGTKPFRDQLLSGKGDRPQAAISKMELVQILGWPEAKSGCIDFQGKRLIVRADDEDPEIWILKCKPSCWRLYFHANIYKDIGHCIIYLLAKCKKADAQDPGDSKKARRIWRDISARRSRIERFRFPPD